MKIWLWNQHEAQTTLLTREDTILIQDDHGGATVILGINEYLKKGNNQLNNKYFYREPRADLFGDHQKTIMDSLNNMIVKNLIDKEMSEILKYQCKIYLLLSASKIHTGRPVISSVNCVNMATTTNNYYIYHTVTDVCIAALVPTKPSTDDDFGFRHGFRAEALLSSGKNASIPKLYALFPKK